MLAGHADDLLRRPPTSGRLLTVWLNLLVMNEKRKVWSEAGVFFNHTRKYHQRGRNTLKYVFIMLVVGFFPAMCC